MVVVVQHDMADGTIVSEYPRQGWSTIAFEVDAELEY